LTIPFAPSRLASANPELRWIDGGSFKKIAVALICSSPTFTIVALARENG